MWTQVLSRLEKLESQNHQLQEEVKVLRDQLAPMTSAATPPTAAEPAEQLPDPIEQRLAVAEQRIDEQAQTKVEASQRFPIRVTGVLLFNAFSNTGASPQAGYSPLLSGPEASGATFRQTLIGLDFHGPALPLDGKASGSITFDLSAPSAANYNNGLNIRRAVLNLDWASRGLEFGQDKPLISRRAPDSLAEVLLPPLSYSGNPWAWVPQVRYVEHLRAGERAGLDLEASVLETEEDFAYLPAASNEHVQRGRPAFEARTAFWLHTTSGTRRLEFAPGFHASSSHVDGYGVPSQYATFDWLVQPFKPVQITGFFAAGRNLSNFGGFTNGFYADSNYTWHPVRSAGGWTQFAVTLTPRLTWNSFAGFQAPRVFGLPYGSLSHDYSFASNLIYRIAPNILIGLEALQERTGYIGQSHFIRDHYDLSLGYLF